MPFQIGHDFIQAAPVNKLHDDEMKSFLLSHAKDRNDVGMVQPGSGLRFPLKALQLFRVQQRMLRQHLQSDAAFQRLLPGLIDDAHPAPAKFTQDVEISQLLRDR